MKKAAYTKLISILLSLVIAVASFPFVPLTAAAADDEWDEALEEYEYFISIKTTNDADGWILANAKFFTFNDDRFTNSSVEKQFDILNDIDDDGEEFRAVFRSKKFLDKVEVHVDFGGGLTWREWAANLTIKINNVSVIGTSLNCSSTPFSSSDRKFSERVSLDNYPRIDSDNSHIFVKSQGENEFGTDLTFYQGKDEEKSKIQGLVYAQLADQYNVVWRNPEEIRLKSKTHPDYDKYEFSHVENNKAVFNVSSTYAGPVNNTYYANDHVSKVTLSCPYHDVAKTYISGDNIQYYTLDLDFNFKFLHDITVNVNKVFFASYREYESTVLNLNSFNFPAGYRLTSVSVSGCPSTVVDNKDNTCVYTVANGDATINVTKKAISYYIDYDKNAADATGTMQYSTVTYDKGSVAIKNCGFVREGYSFVGWNTEPDGSGTRFAGGSGVSKPNLTTQNGAHVKLYAQWGKNVLSVRLKYPLETGREDRIVYINRLLSIQPEECLPADSADGHFTYHGADKDLSKITEDMTVNLSYDFVPHNYGEAFVSVEPTCTTDGVETRICEDCAYEKNTVIPAAHQLIGTTEGYPATCSEDGAESVIKCFACDTVIEQGGVIPAYGHDYNVKKADWTFTTDEGELKAFVIFPCKNDKTHLLTKQATVTQTDKGYLAKTEFNGKEVSQLLRLGKDIFSITVNAGDGGTVTASEQLAFAKDVVRFDYRADAGKFLTDISVKSGTTEVPIDGNSFVMPKGNVEITATFSDTAANQCGENAFWKYEPETKTLTVAGTGAMFDYAYGGNTGRGLSPWANKRFSDSEAIERIVVEDGITHIGSNAFYYFRSDAQAVEVIMADSVISIGDCAFRFAKKLGKIRLSGNLQTIGKNAFEQQDETNYSFHISPLPTTLTNVGSQAFCGVIQNKIYCFADPDNLTFENAKYDFLSGKKTTIYVRDEYLETYKQKFDETVRATFAGGLDSRTYTIALEESEHGSVSASDSIAASGDLIKLSCVLEEGYALKHYLVTDSGNTTTVVNGDSFVMPAGNVSVSAVFSPLYTITAAPEGDGVIYVCDEAAQGQTVKVSVESSVTHKFAGITVTDSEGEEIQTDNLSFVMPASDVTVSALFTKCAHELSYTTYGNGSVEGRLYADSGDAINLTVTPETGVRLKTVTVFDEEGNDIELGENNSFVMPDSDVKIVTEFETIKYNITYSSEHGTLSSKTTAAYGETVQFSVSPDEGYELSDISTPAGTGYIPIDRESGTFTMPARDVTIVGTFLKNSGYRIYLGDYAGGTVTTIDETPSPGTTVKLNPQPEKGMYLKSLTVRGEELSEPYTFTMPYSDVTVSAAFDYNSYPVTATAQNGEIVLPFSSDSHYDFNSNIECRLSPRSNFHRTSVSVTDMAGNDVEYTILKNYNDIEYVIFRVPYGGAIIHAEFEPDMYNITYNDVENGSISGLESAAVGETVVLTASPAQGYIFKSACVEQKTSNGGTNELDFDGKTMSFIMGESDVSVTPAFVTDKCGENAYWSYDRQTQSVSVSGTGSMFDFVSSPPWSGLDVKRVVIGTGITRVGNNAFSHAGIESVYIADTVESIGYAAFSYNPQLKSVRMSDRLTSLGDYSFAYNTALNQFDFPATLSEVGIGAFKGTTGMADVYCYPESYCQFSFALEQEPSENFMSGRQTHFHVKSTLCSLYANHYRDIINATFVGDLDVGDPETTYTPQGRINIEHSYFGTVRADFTKAPAGRVISLSITPVASYQLKALTVLDNNGDPVLLEDNCFIMPEGDVTVSAEYERVIHTIHKTTAINGSFGCADGASWGETVEVLLTPDIGYTLKSFTVTDANGNDIELSNINTFVMPEADVTVCAEFEKLSYSVSYNTAEHGSVSGAATASYASLIALDITPDDNYRLASLSVETLGGEPVNVSDESFIMPNAPVVVSASFERIPYNISYHVSQNGTVSGEISAYYGDTVTLNITPDIGCALESLSVTDADENEIELTDNAFTMPKSAVTVTAVFRRNNYSISYSEIDNGVVSGVENSTCGKIINPQITPNLGYELESLIITNGNGDEIESSGNSFTMPDSDVTVSAVFKKVSSNIYYLSSENGYVSGLKNAQFGDTVSVYAEAEEGYCLNSIIVKTLSGDDVSSAANSFTMPQKAVRIKGIFEKIHYNINYSYSLGGTVGGAATANFGDTVTPVITPDTGYVLDTLLIKDAADNEIILENGCFTMPAGVVFINASFKPIDYSITYIPSEYGIISGPESANYGDKVELSSAPVPGKEAVSYTVTDENHVDIPVVNGSFTMPAANVSVAASYEDCFYTVEWIVAGAIAQTDEDVLYGAEAEYNGIIPADYSDGEKHYSFFGWSDGTNNYAADSLPAVTGNVVYTAVYNEEYHSFGEPVWSWAEDLSSATASFTCSVCSGEKKLSADIVKADDGKTYTASVLSGGKEYSDVKIKEAASNGYSLTLADSIQVNYLIDTSYYGAEDGYLIYEYVKTTDEESAERVMSEAISIASLQLCSIDGTYFGNRVLSLKAAPAQIAEEYILHIYSKDGVEQATLKTSIADYCERLKNDAIYGELMQSLLNYGQLANEYFGYGDLVDGEYLVPHSDNYTDALSVQESEILSSGAVSKIETQGNARIIGVSYIAQMQPEFKFFFEDTDSTQATVFCENRELSVSAQRTRNKGVVVRVSGLNSCDFGKVFSVTLDGTTITYNGYAYIRTALKKAETKFLAQGIFRYAQAAEKAFN